MAFKVRVVPISGDTLVQTFNNENDAADFFDTVRDQMYNDTLYGRRQIVSAILLDGDNFLHSIKSPENIQIPQWLVI